MALARSMVVQPDILLLDEPLGALDAALRRQMQRELKNIQEQVGITFVHVTHDQEEAMNIADRMIVLHQGVIQDQGTPEQIYHRPSSDFSAQFMGDNNFVEGVIAGRQGDMVQIDTAIGNFNIQADGNASHVSGLTIGSQVTFTIRPENVRVLRDEDGKDNIIRNARLKEINFVGSVTNVIAEIDGFGEFKVQLHGMDSLDTLRDQTILLNFDPKDAFLLG